MSSCNMGRRRNITANYSAIVTDELVENGISCNEESANAVSSLNAA